MIPLLVMIAVLIAFSLLLWASLSSLKRRRLLEDLPTSKTIGVFIGLVELKGTAESESPLTGRLSGKRCVWYSWNVQEHWSRTVTETDHDKDGKPQTRTRTESGWTTVASGGESEPFYLQDDLGVIRINPRKAEIHSQNVFSRTCSTFDPFYHEKGPATTIADSTGERSFTEQAILLHQPLYVVGQSHVRDDCVAAEIAYDSSAPMFMISTSTEESHRAWGLWKFRFFGLLFVLIPVIAGIALVQQANDLRVVIGVPTAICGVMLLIWGAGWFWMVYNSLVGLKNRVKMATANMDVELKRRYDLIPQIVRVIEGMQKHECDTQETLALLRNQSAIDAVDNASAAKGCANRLVALAESYPDLKSNELFLSMHRALTETEQRIALARNYYNDVVETHNNRRERFPENFIAAVAGLHPVAPFVAEDFEHAAVQVQFVQ
ncbi:MAG: LemA family protein [Planctomycetaceae bacterium]|nr:LemA family protein [Planctomycetaceae bacterium]